MKKFFKVFAILISACLLTFCFTALTFAAEVKSSGSCGDNLTWTLDSDGVLTISGNGAMSNMYLSKQPWESDLESITKVVIENGVTSIGRSAFYNCKSLTSIEIPDSVTTIDKGAFYGCISLKEIEITACVESINIGAFTKCYSLEKIVVDEGNSKYDSRDNCNAIIETKTSTLVAGCKNSTIPSGVTSIGDYAFQGCFWLNEIEIPDTVTSIGKSAFYDCVGLTDVNIPDGITSIGSYAFFDCASLLEVEIPSTVTSIGKYVFNECISLEKILIDENNAVYDSRDNCNAIIETASNTLICGCKNSTVPDTVTTIGDYAFSNCHSLTEINIPNGVTSIGEGAFDFCFTLSQVSLPESLVSIGENAFQECQALTSVVIPDNITTIEFATFDNCISLKSITIPYSVTSIKEGAFHACENLDKVEYYGCNEENWNKISIDVSNEALSNAEISYYHSYTEENVEPTYTEAGYTLHTCKICGDSYKDNYLAPGNANEAFSDIYTCSTGVKTTITWAASQYIVRGYSDGTFKPTKTCTRAEMVIMLYRIANKPTVSDYAVEAIKQYFSDVDQMSNSVLKAIAWATYTGLIKGYDDGTFRPNDGVSRASTVVMLWRMAGSPETEAESTFTDTQDCSEGVMKAINWAFSKGITKGSLNDDGTYSFAPYDLCQRQHIATFLYRFTQKTTATGVVADFLAALKTLADDNRYGWRDDATLGYVYNNIYSNYLTASNDTDNQLGFDCGQFITVALNMAGLMEDQWEPFFSGWDYCDSKMSEAGFERIEYTEDTVLQPGDIFINVNSSDWPLHVGVYLSGERGYEITAQSCDDFDEKVGDSTGTEIFYGRFTGLSDSLKYIYRYVG